jgi:hypothetical protein
MRTWSCGVRRLGSPRPQVSESTTGIVWTSGPLIVSVDLHDGDLVPDTPLMKSFKRATQTPLAAGVGPPSRLRVSSASLARRLAKLLPEVKVEHVATPEVDRAFARVASGRDSVPPPPEAEASELDPDSKALYRSIGTELFVARPWSTLPDRVPVEIRVDALDIRAGRLFTLGGDGHLFGYLLFSTPEAHRAFEAMSRKSGPAVESPPFYGFDLDPAPGEILDPAMQGKILPLPVMRVFEGGAHRAAGEAERRAMLGVAVALARFCQRHRRALGNAMQWDEGVKGRYRVPILGETIAVRFHAHMLDD